MFTNPNLFVLLKHYYELLGSADEGVDNRSISSSIDFCHFKSLALDSKLRVNWSIKLDHEFTLLPNNVIVTFRLSLRSRNKTHGLFKFKNHVNVNSFKRTCSYKSELD